MAKSLKSFPFFGGLLPFVWLLYKNFLDCKFYSCQGSWYLHLYEHRNVKLRWVDDWVKLFHLENNWLFFFSANIPNIWSNLVNVVNLVFDGWGKESGEPPGSHPGPQGRMDSVERFEKIFRLLCSSHELNFADFIYQTFQVFPIVIRKLGIDLL